MSVVLSSMVLDRSEELASAEICAPAHEVCDPRINKLIASFYRAAAGDLSWSDALTELATFFSAWGVHLVGIRLADGGITLTHDVGPGMSAESTLDYLLRWRRSDPRSSLVMGKPVNEWMRCHEHFDEAFVAGDRFFQDFLIPNGGRYVSGTRVYQDEEIVVLLGIHRGLGSQPLNNEEIALASRLGQHIQAALGLWRRHLPASQQALVGRAVLSRLPQPVLLIDEQLRLQFCNDAARQFLDADTRLTERDGMLACGTADDHVELVQATRRLGVTGSRLAGNTPARVIVRVGNGRGQRADMLLILSPLDAAETLYAFGRHSLTLVWLHDFEVRGKPDAALLAEAYGLTTAEARVAARLAAGAAPECIAKEGGVSLHTVRTQTYAVYEKMGVSRQSELAAILAGASASMSMMFKNFPTSGP